MSRFDPMQINGGFYMDRACERVHTDRKKSLTGACIGRHLGIKLKRWKRKSGVRERAGYKYRMMQWCNDVRGREQGSRESDRLCFINSALRSS